jgi:hypothetical protein
MSAALARRPDSHPHPPGASGLSMRRPVLGRRCRLRPLDRVVERLEGVCENGTGFVARCPVPGHGKGCDDRNPSLSVSEGDDGRAVLHCHAGCAIEDVVGRQASR